MEFARFENIVALKNLRRSGSVVGFHAHNLQIAHLDELAWQALTEAKRLATGTEPTDRELELLKESKSEIEAWNQENDPETTDVNVPLKVRSLAINVAQICNLKCSYCAAGGDGTFGDPMKQVDLSILFEQIRMLLHDVPSGETFKFTFLGGEPLIAPDAIRAISRFVKLQVAGRGIQIRYAIVTNGTLVTSEIAELLASIQADVTVSIDGPTEVNDRNRPTRAGTSSTLKTLKGIDELLKVKDRLGSLSSGSVFGKHYTGVVETYKFLQPMGFHSIRFDFAVEAGDEEASRQYVDEIHQVADLAWSIGGEDELRRITIFDGHFRILDNKRRIQSHCGAGKSHLHVDTRGSLTTCQWFSGDKKEEIGFGTEIDHQRLEEYADPLTAKHSCSTCWVRNLCGGGCMYVNKAKTGSKHQKDSEFCIRTRGIIAKGIEYYAEARYEEQQGDRSETH